MTTTTITTTAATTGNVGNCVFDVMGEAVGEEVDDMEFDVVKESTVNV
jgi:hypothetical protein